MNKNTILVLEELRKNSRFNIRAISKRTKLSVSTVKSKIKELEDNKIIKKYTSLIDFSGINLLQTIFFMDADNNLLNELKNTKKYPFINNMIKISNDYNLLVECVFPKINDYLRFKEKLKSKNIKFNEYFVIQDLTRESFRINKDSKRRASC